MSNQKIADSLGVSRASASEMVRKLIQEGFVLAEGRQLSLSAEGQRIAKRILSRHRLWESFLMTKLEYEEAEVHEQAELLEHISDEKLMERLNAYLQYPKTCPHGAVIYENEARG